MPLLIIEGGEGSGKDTQINLLKERLDPEHTVFVREPGGTELGEKMRAILLTETMAPETELFLFLAARTELVHNVIGPALLRGKLVVSNRFELSTIAYQIYGRQRHNLLEPFRAFSKNIFGVMKPYYILIDIEPCLGLQRVKSRGDGETTFDAETLEFHERVQKGFLTHYNDDNRGVCVDGADSVEEISRQIARQMKRWHL
ncbi:MAG TPA: dTMP kinase [Candidatus Paceibacterota bacterium]|nr:dTMP kinase [Candidatus Paceibacterota bacterium]